MIKTVVFDIGQVLIGWDPKKLYKEVFKTDEEIENFFNEIDFFNWNLSMDKGKSFTQGVAEKQIEFPKYQKEIALFDTEWKKTVTGAFDESVEVLKELKKKGYPVYALTNFSSEKFKIAQEMFDFLNTFDGLLVSGDEKMIKPDPNFFLALCKKYSLNPETSLFIDDNKNNINSAKNLGFKTILFRYPDLLKPQVQEFGVKI